MHKKQFYEAPDAELLVVRFEENFCTTGGGNQGGIQDITEGDVVDESDIWKS